MIRSFLAMAAVIAVSIAANGSASAQDILRSLYSPRPVANWTGFYIGGNAGYGWARDSSNALSPLGSSASSFTMKGLSAGGQIGGTVHVYGPWVMGIESDLQASWQKFDGPGNATNLINAVGFPPATAETTRMDWFGTTRLRMGIAEDRVLFYGTAGLAYGNVKFDASTAGFTVVDYNPVQFGWTAGGGIELMLTHNWTLRGEFLHIDFGGFTTRFTTSTGVIDDLHQRITNDIVRLGVNYYIR